MRKLVLLAAVLTLAFAPAPLPRRAGGPKEPNVHGDWEVVSWSIRRKESELTVYLLDAARIVPRRLEAFFQREYQFRWALTFDLSASPPRVDLYDDESGQRMLGIYQLEGDTLTICYAERRPTEFHKTRQWLVVLKRK